MVAVITKWNGSPLAFISSRTESLPTPEGPEITIRRGLGDPIDNEGTADFAFINKILIQYNGAKSLELSLPVIVMPTYEYRCNDCNHKFELFLSYQEYENTVISCPSCGAAGPERIIRPVRISRAEKTRLDSLSDPGLLEGLDDDPQTLGRMMREMSTELGEDMGSEFDEVVDRLEKGQTPEEIERDLPDLDPDNGIPGPSLDD